MLIIFCVPCQSIQIFPLHSFLCVLSRFGSTLLACSGGWGGLLYWLMWGTPRTKNPPCGSAKLMSAARVRPVSHIFFLSNHDLSHCCSLFLMKCASHSIKHILWTEEITGEISAKSGPNRYGEKAVFGAKCRNSFTWNEKMPNIPTRDFIHSGYCHKRGNQISWELWTCNIVTKFVSIGYSQLFNNGTIWPRGRGVVERTSDF